MVIYKHEFIYDFVVIIHLSLDLTIGVMINLYLIVMTY